MSTNNEFKIQIGAVINPADLNLIQKQLLNRKMKTELRLDLSAFAKDKAEAAKQISYLSTEIKKILGSAVTDKQASKWARDFYGAIEVGARKAIAEQNKLTAAVERTRKAEQTYVNNAVAKIGKDQYTGVNETKILQAKAALEGYGLSATQVQEKLKGVNAALTALNSSKSNYELIANAEKLNTEFKKLENQIKITKLNYDKFSAPADSTRVIKMVADLNAYMSTNSAITKQAKSQIRGWIDTLNAGGASVGTLKNINNEFIMLRTNMQSMGRIGKSWSDQMKQAFSSFGVWLSATSMMMAGWRTAKKMVTAVHDIDTAMTNLYKVTDETDARYQKFLKNAVAGAKEVGASISSYITQVSDWSKLGFSIDQAEALTNTSMIYSKVGELDDKTAVKDLVATMKAFNIEASDSIKIVDSLNILGNRFATDSASLGDGLSRSASALAFAGNDLHQTLAMLTGGTEITQSASEMGNSLKVLSMRVRGMKGKLEELGEEYENVESISKIQTQILNRTDGAVNIFGDDGDFRSTYDILFDISKVWDKISKTDQANLCLCA